MLHITVLSVNVPLNVVRFTMCVGELYYTNSGIWAVSGSIVSSDVEHVSDIRSCCPF
jgi:hypothetical protein